MWKNETQEFVHHLHEHSLQPVHVLSQPGVVPIARPSKQRFEAPTRAPTNIYHALPALIHRTIITSHHLPAVVTPRPLRRFQHHIHFRSPVFFFARHPNRPHKLTPRPYAYQTMTDRLFSPTTPPHFSSPSGNVMSAALAAARSTMSTSLPTTSQSTAPVITPLPGLKHDLMMLAGVDLGGPSSSPPTAPIAHPIPSNVQPSALKPRVGRQPTAGVQKRARKRSREPARFFCQTAGCAKAFRTQGDLHAHMRIHTGEEPFACSFPYCERRYKWRSSLAHHEGLHIRKKGALIQRRPRKARVTAITQQELQPQSTPELRDKKQEFEL